MYRAGYWRPGNCILAVRFNVADVVRCSACVNKGESGGESEVKKRFRSTLASRLKVGSASIWQLPSIFLLTYCAAKDGFFSRVLLEDGVQLPLLLRLTGMVLFGYIRVPG